LRVDRLYLKDFRNYEELDFVMDKNITIFVGDSAQGKTNVLESIFLLATGRSHRTNRDQELLRWNSTSFTVKAQYMRQGIGHAIEYRFTEGAKQKTIQVDGVESKVKDIIGQITTVFFSPEDLQLVKGMPALRRRFIDLELSQVNPAYYRYLQQYNRILFQRNNALRLIRERKQPEQLLDVWDNQLAEVGAKIVQKRMEAVKRLAILARLMQRKITDGQEELSLQYESGSEYKNIPEQAQEIMDQELKKARSQDIMRANTSIGPHRDDLLLMVNGNNLRIFGSQGQQRTGVLALKLAELEFMKSETGEYLVETIKDRVQTFITTTGVYNLDVPLDKSAVVTVKNGQIRRE
jgi:DNA replication and repair protein RecF